MDNALPQIYVVRHGETDWSKTGQHTGLTDLPLTALGKQDAEGLRGKLSKSNFEAVLCSPLLRAKQTCELAGFASMMQIEPDLLEWNYGDYEGLTTKEITKKHPGWNIFLNGCPNGESPEQVASRAGRIVTRLKKVERGNVLLIAHGHILRVIAAVWLNLPVEGGALFALSPASISILGYEHDFSEPCMKLWNAKP